MKRISEVILITILGASVAVAQSAPPPMPGGQQPGNMPPGDAYDEFDDEFDDGEEYSDNLLTEALFDVVYGLEEYAYENCDSKKHRGKFTSTSKVLKQLVKRMSKLPGVDAEIKADLNELHSTIKDLNSSLKDLCDPAQKDRDDYEDDDAFEDDF